MLAVALAGSSSGCFGSFAATRALYDFNEGASGDGIVRSLVMVALLIIPAYELFALGDILIFNTLEFWTGDNPIAMGERGGDAVAKLETAVDERGALTLKQGGVEYVLAPIGDGRYVVRRGERELGLLELGEDGALMLFDVNGQPMRVIDANEVRQTSEELAVVLEGA